MSSSMSRYLKSNGVDHSLLRAHIDGVRIHVILQLVTLLFNASRRILTMPRFNAPKCPLLNAFQIRNN